MLTANPPSSKGARISFGIMRQSALCCGINFRYVVLSKEAKIGDIDFSDPNLRSQLADLISRNSEM